MVNHIDKDKPFYPTDHCGVIRIIDKNKINPRYLALALEKVGKEFGFSRHYRASIDRIKGITIEVPSIELQNDFARKVQMLESRIDQAKTIIEGAKERKEKVMEKYL